MGFAEQMLAAARSEPLAPHPFIAGLADRAFTRASFRIYLTYHYPMVRDFPRQLARLLAGCHDPEVRCHLLANLLEEEGIAASSDGTLVRSPEKSHVALFRRCADVLGMRLEDSGQIETAAWFEQEIAQNRWLGPAAFVMVGIEGNVPRTFRRILPYLEQHCGFAGEEVVFFREHIEADEDHAAQGAALIEMAARTAEDRRQALAGTQRGARTWWALHRLCAREMKRASRALTAP